MSGHRSEAAGGAVVSAKKGPRFATSAELQAAVLAHVGGALRLTVPRDERQAMLDYEVRERLVAEVRPDHFLVEAHRHIWTAIVASAAAE